MRNLGFCSAIAELSMNDANRKRIPVIAAPCVHGTFCPFAVIRPAPDQDENTSNRVQNA
jgi:hypothetical protein